MVVDLDIQYLWREQKVEEDVIKSLVNMSFEMLENPNYTKIPEIKECLFQILLKCMDKFGSDLKYMQSQNSTKIIDLLYNQEQMAPYMAEFVNLVTEKQGN